ncbi:MAG TPA: RsmB/NOP family class I SAM-dependent RNA methyltransferase [Anaerolineae bacterium]|nr:RsmB/NOP family class I SAM-dependent RNA methyltransferase [Anaerolineae bacterium]
MAKETALPLAFMARMAALLDEEFPPFLAMLNQRPVPALRVNTLKLSVEQFLALSPWALTPVPWCPEGFTLDRKVNIGTHTYHEIALYYVQDASAMAVAALTAPQPGERVLDLCASPGGKSTHLASLLAGQGVLVANEIDRGRADVLRRNLERWGATNTLVLNETPERLAERWPGAFDRVVVDAPCSGEGMFRKNEEARYHWSEAHVLGCALRQREILHSAAQLVRPGGRLVYATCTFAPEEDEGVIARFLRSHPDFTLLPAPRHEGFQPGQPAWADWPAAPEDQTPDPSLAGAVRLWPHKLQGEGHFVAVMQRAGDGPPAAWKPAQLVRLAPSDRAALEAFWQPLIGRPLPERLLLRPRQSQEVEVSAPPEDAPDTAGLRTAQAGWRLGVLRKGRFEPSHALAMALRAEEVSQRIDQPIGGELAARFMRGETLDAPGPDGWVLIAVEDFPVGWGKRVGGVVKNHYPKSLRWG